ncbi:hypothetical protein EVAR_58927_1 [Eumeta japonica]|uniref:Uncharacterized protein n=1 Tax=Eumeta variegata TaxID=151549 RepID=A0A4C1YA13_EUMVA|nr:hypothetical protein EVAR_58927_1 [Eumeta japonica]
MLFCYQSFLGVTFKIEFPIQTEAHTPNKLFERMPTTINPWILDRRAHSTEESAFINSLLRLGRAIPLFQMGEIEPRDLHVRHAPPARG